MNRRGIERVRRTGRRAYREWGYGGRHDGDGGWGGTRSAASRVDEEGCQLVQFRAIHGKRVPKNFQRPLNLVQERTGCRLRSIRGYVTRMDDLRVKSMIVLCADFSLKNP